MNWKHSLYEIAALTLGQSFTVDEAYRVLHEMREDRLFSIASSFAESKRSQAKVINAKVVQEDYQKEADSKANFRRAEADLLETQARFILAQPCLDMARIELAFIDHMIKHIQSSSSLMFENRAIGAQLVQPIERAFEYLWHITFNPPDSDLLRNLYFNPYHEQVFAAKEALKKFEVLNLKTVATTFAEVLDIPKERLSISVNYQNMIEAQKPLLLEYSAASNRSLELLEEKSNAQLSRNDT